MSTASTSHAGRRGRPASHNGHFHSPSRLHRLAEVRRQQGVSLRRVARALKVDIREVRKQEKEESDLPLSQLYGWCGVLEVPISDLLVEHGDELSAPILERARLLKVMKTAATLLERAPGGAMQRLAQQLVDQLVEVMPELKGVGPWHSVGQRRSLHEYGRAVERGRYADAWRDL